MIQTGKIIKIISNLYTVKYDKNKILDCRARGKFRHTKITPLVGDLVEFDDEECYITNILKRNNYLDRPSIANVDVALILTSVKKPDLSLNLLDKLILVVKSKDIEPVICISKVDLASSKEKKDLKKIFKYYQKIGFQVFNNTDIKKMLKYLKGKTVVLTGQTGSGKSTLLNHMDKKLNLETKPISDALGRGVHTTRHTEIHEIKGVYFADTPGFSSIDLKDINKDNIIYGFPEFLDYSCEFKNCSHTNEQTCEVKKAVLKGIILESRYDNYKSFLKELK